MNKAKLNHYQIYYHNSEEYHLLKREIFTQKLYYFETNNPQPIIIDAGAHIGLATLYFKQLYPQAKITAIEPNPTNYQLLQQNIFENQLNDITVVPVALSNQTSTETIFFDSTQTEWYSTTSFHQGSWVGTQKSNSIIIPTHPLSEFITQPIDLLKMDIEGAEQKVLLNAVDSLPLIKQFIIEFHPHPSQSLKELLAVLELTHNLQLFQGTKEVKPTKTHGLVMIHGSLSK